MPLPDDQRGVSRLIGAVLLIGIMLLLAVTAMAAFGGLANDSVDASAVHGMASYDFEYQEERGHMITRAESIQTRNTNFYVHVNGQQVYEWNGKDELDISCLYPEDRIRIVTEKGESTNLLREYTMDRALKCDLSFTDQFEYVVINGDQRKVKSEYTFDLAIDPDGGSPSHSAGPDDEYGDTKIPLSNDWHFQKQYAGPIEGLGTGQKPVYLFIMADNVHTAGAPDWPSVSNSGALGWTDPIPAGKDPGSNNYEIDGGNSLDPVPSSTGPGDGEPTNDVYMLFEPGCDSSRIMIAYYDGGYHNSIYMDGTEVVTDTHAGAPTDPNNIGGAPVYDAPGIPCFDG